MKLLLTFILGLMVCGLGIYSYNSFTKYSEDKKSIEEDRKSQMYTLQKELYFAECRLNKLDHKGEGMSFWYTDGSQEQTDVIRYCY